MKWTKPSLVKLSGEMCAIGACSDGSSALPGGGCSVGSNPGLCNNGNQAVGGVCQNGAQEATGCKKGANG